MYEISHQQYKRFVMIKHIGIPLHNMNGKLITPHKIVWWWPYNWLTGVVGVFKLLLSYRR